MIKSKLYVAAAGAGKTTKIIEEVINVKEKVLILTYTNDNYNQIISRIKNKIGIIPNNIIVMTWYSFLLKDGVLPYQGIIYKKRIEGIHFENKPDEKRYYLKKENISYYINVNNNKIYQDKVSDFSVKVNQLTKGSVINRIFKIYSKIYIDEIQDIVGYDLEFIKLLIERGIELIMFGDPRQVTYSTHNAKKYLKYSNGKIVEFFKKEIDQSKIDIDEKTMNISYRNNDIICGFANKIFPEMPGVSFVKESSNEIDCVNIIEKENVEKYLKEYNPIQLRYSKKTQVNNNFTVYNFGESKGLEFDRVLIYPTKDMIGWIKENNNSSKPLKDNTRSKFYVAVTRAAKSVTFIVSKNFKSELPKFDENLNLKFS